MKDINEIFNDTSYNGWWQFEEGMQVINGEGVNLYSSIRPTERSYGVVSLRNPGGAVANSFILEQEGLHIVDIFGLSSLEDKGFTVIIDGTEQYVSKDTIQDCISVEERVYCHYIVKAFLSEGEHLMEIHSKGGKIELDRFKITRRVPVQGAYSIQVVEYSE